MSTIGRTTLAAMSLALLGCASNVERVQDQVQTVEEEQSPDKLMARGEAFARVGDFTRAEQYLSAAIDAGADPKKVLPKLLKVCLAEQRYRSALSHAEPLLKQDPEDFRLRFVVGSLYAAIGDTTTAREHLAKVVEAKPDFAEVHFAMGMLALEGEGDRVTADGHFREYLRLEPDGKHAREARGYLLRTVP